VEGQDNNILQFCKRLDSRHSVGISHNVINLSLSLSLSHTHTHTHTHVHLCPSIKKSNVPPGLISYKTL